MTNNLIKTKLLLFSSSLLVASLALGQASPVECRHNNNEAEICDIRGMVSLSQRDRNIPDTFKTKKITKNTTCGPTAVASLYSAINNNSKFYSPQSGSFVSKLSKSKNYEEVIPELFIEMKTSNVIGTLPFNIYTKGIPAKFLEKGKSFNHFLDDKSSNITAKDFFDWVKNKHALIAILVGFYREGCITLLGVTKCSYLPMTLHYEALSGVVRTPENNFVLKLFEGDGGSPLHTGLNQITSDCKSRGPFGICKLSYNPPLLQKRAMSFSSDSSQFKTFLHGMFGLHK